MMRPHGEGNADDSGISMDAEDVDKRCIQGRPSIDLSVLGEAETSIDSMYEETPCLKKIKHETSPDVIEIPRSRSSNSSMDMKQNSSERSTTTRLYHGLERMAQRAKRSMRHVHSSPHFDHQKQTTLDEKLEEPEEKYRKIDALFSEGLEGTVLLRQSSTGPVEKGEFASETSPDHLPSVLEVHYTLPILPDITSQAFRLISRDTLWAEYRRLGGRFQDKFVLIDCRYEYEYEGGHLENAINLFDPKLLQSFFFPSCPKILEATKTKLPIFYCEFSEVRGPRMANELRKLDRGKNATRYPHVDYPEIYVLAAGYKGIWQDDNEVEMKAFCTPNGYVAMYDKKHSEELRRLRQHKSRRNKPRPSALAVGKFPCRKAVGTHPMTPKKRYSFEIDELATPSKQIGPRQIVFPDLDSDTSEKIA